MMPIYPLLVRLPCIRWVGRGIAALQVFKCPQEYVAGLREAGYWMHQVLPQVVFEVS
jgi:hypothetical protein